MGYSRPRSAVPARTRAAQYWPGTELRNTCPAAQPAGTSGRDAVEIGGRQHREHRDRKVQPDPARSEAPSMYGNTLCGNWEIPRPSVGEREPEAASGSLPIEFDYRFNDENIETGSPSVMASVGVLSFNARSELRQRIHTSIPEQGAYLRSILLGHFHYHGMPMNGPALSAFHKAVEYTWRTALRRRSQGNHLPWRRMNCFISRWFASASICHPYPLIRLGVLTQGGSR